MRRAVLLLVLLALPASVAGCFGDVRAQKTNFSLYLDASETGVLDRFAILEVVVTHASLKPNTTAAEPASIHIGRRVDLVGVRDGGPERIVNSAKIPYYVYDAISIGVNVTNALLMDGTPVDVKVPENNIYCFGKEIGCSPKPPFRTRLAGDVAYDFVLSVQQGANGEYFIQSRPDESGARSV